MSRLASSRNVEWSEEGATNWVYSRTQDRVNLSSLRSGYFDERTKKMNEISFLRNMNCIFGKKTKASYLMTETLMVQKLAYILASRCDEELFSYLFSFLKKSAKKLKKELEIFKILFFISIFAQKNQNGKFLVFSLRRSLQNPRTFYKVMNHIFCFGDEI